MSTKEPLHIPSPAGIQAAVRHTPEAMKPGPEIPRGIPSPTAAPAPAEARSSLSSEAETFLRMVASTEFEGLNLSQLWKIQNVTSGSARRKHQNELIRHGFIRLISKGKSKGVQVYPAGYAHLGLELPKGQGRGGEDHRLYTAQLQRTFKTAGFDTHIEFEVGPRRKRVDLVAFGQNRIGVEIAMGDLKQELHNLREDLASGALDIVIVASPSKDFLRKLHTHVLLDPELKAQTQRIKYRLLEELDA
jgi:hypothetical protein